MCQGYVASRERTREEAIENLKLLLHSTIGCDTPETQGSVPYILPTQSSPELPPQTGRPLLSSRNYLHVCLYRTG